MDVWAEMGHLFSAGKHSMREISALTPLGRQGPLDVR
jgi:hypothetical protein